MARYDWLELLRRWGQKKLSAEQTIGQLPQWDQEAARALTQLGTQLERLTRLVAKLGGRVEAVEQRLDGLENCQKRRGKDGTVRR